MLFKKKNWFGLIHVIIMCVVNTWLLWNDYNSISSIDYDEIKDLKQLTTELLDELLK